MEAKEETMDLLSLFQTISKYIPHAQIAIFFVWLYLLYKYENLKDFAIQTIVTTIGIIGLGWLGLAKGSYGFFIPAP